MQTIPSIALLALLIPFMGIGQKPAILALFLYSLLPIARSTITALLAIPPVYRQVAAAMRSNALPAAEKMLAIAAVAVLLGFLFSPHPRFAGLFDFSKSSLYDESAGWFNTLAFLGSVFCIILISMDLFGVRAIGQKIKVKLLILVAALPALGFVIDKLNDFWGALMFAGMIVMLYIGAKIGTREKIIKVTRSEG